MRTIDSPTRLLYDTEMPGIYSGNRLLKKMIHRSEYSIGYICRIERLDDLLQLFDIPSI